ncbi:uncharacterized protein [Watersipora subatra]|uniref:uncharacterized protein n=1 Tax=Watersipora subatra TaxID=2589382 RepID=UPI00355C8395
MGCNESKDVTTYPKKDTSPKKTVPGNSVAPQTSSKKTTGCPIKFTHFGDGGRCEPLMMIFAYGHIPYENEIINPKDWPAIKPKTKMGTLPIMTVGSEELVSSLAILTYLAGEADLKGATPEEQAACDSLVYSIEECRGADLFLNRFALLTKSMDEETRLAKAKEFTEGPLAKLSKHLEASITGSTWLLSKLTAADFWLYGTMKAMTDMFIPDAWSSMGPKVQKWRDNFRNIPEIKEYLDKQCAGSTAMSKDVMKLTYFDVRGRVEPYRMIFAHTGVPHEEERVKFDDWPAMKPTTPMGYLPVLRVGGSEITTSLAILKYIAKECGLDGRDEEATCDTIVYTIEDCRSAVFPTRFKIRSKTEDEETPSKVTEFVEKTLPPFLDYLERHMTGTKWLLKELSVADFWLYGTMEVIEDSAVPDIWSRVSPRLQAWKKDFEALPKVKDYCDSRPKNYTL